MDSLIKFRTYRSEERAMREREKMAGKMKYQEVILAGMDHLEFIRRTAILSG